MLLLIAVKPGFPELGIIFSLKYSKRVTGFQGYNMDIKADKVVIEYSDKQGLYYALSLS